MSKRMTVGNRIAKKVGLSAFNNGCYFPQVVEAMVNAAIRRAQAKAWDEGAIVRNRSSAHTAKPIPREEEVICYRDMTFCTAYEDGRCINSDCHRAFDALDLSMAKKWWSEFGLEGAPPIAWSDFWNYCETRIEA